METQNKQIVIIEAQREGYSINQVRRTMTNAELVAYLEENFEDDSPVYLSHDNGYTFGGITQSCIKEDYTESEDDEEE